MAEPVVTFRLGVFFGVSGINAVDIGGLEYGLGFELCGSQHRGRISRKKGIAGARGEQHDATFAEVLHGSLAVISLAYNRHCKRR